VCIAFAASDAAKGATSIFNVSHAFAVAGLVPFNVERALASPYVRNCERDIEREDEAMMPYRIHAGSPVLTAPEFLERLAAFVAAQALPRPAGSGRAGRARGVAVPMGPGSELVPDPTAPPLDEDELEVDLLAPIAKAFEKLTAATERIEPTAWAWG
jgi:hypothetical protein